MIHTSRKKAQLRMAVSNVDVCVWAYEGRLQLLKSALEENLDKVIMKRDNSERTALHWACSSGKTDVVGFLITNGAEVSPLCFFNFIPILFR